MLMDNIDEELAAILGEDFPSTTTGLPQLSLEPLALLQNPTNFSVFSAIKVVDNHDHRASSTQVILKFGNANSIETNHQQVMPMSILDDEVLVASRDEGSKQKRRVRPASATYDHIMAERRRREQLSQLFVALTAIVPGLKKMDKTSILGDTIKYLKNLEEQVTTLELKSTKRTVESVVLVSKTPSQMNTEDKGSSDDKSGTTTTSKGQPLPEIEARFCDKTILLKIHCEKRKGVLVKVLAEVEKMNLLLNDQLI